METLFRPDSIHTAVSTYPKIHGTGSRFAVRKNTAVRFLNSRIYRDDSTTMVIRESIKNDNIIRLKNSFLSEIDKLDGILKIIAQLRFENTLDYIMEIDPDMIGVEVTHEDSMYFSLKKDSFSIYIEEYLDDNEIIVSMYDNDDKLESISGMKADVTAKIMELVQ